MKKVDWPNHIVNLITVVISILLAFALNTSYENYKDRQNAQKHIDGLKKEILRNKEVLDSTLPYHQKLVDQLRKNPEKVNLIIKSADLKNYAWNIAERNAIDKHISYDLYLALTESYLLQESLYRHNESAGNHMNYTNIIGPYLSAANYSDKDFDHTGFLKIRRAGWIPIFEDMVYYEKSLRNQYLELLAQLP